MIAAVLSQCPGKKIAQCPGKKLAVCGGLCYVPLVCGTDEPASFGIPASLVVRKPMYFKLGVGATVYYVPAGAVAVACPGTVETSIIEVLNCDGDPKGCIECFGCCYSNLSWARTLRPTFDDDSGDAVAAFNAMPDEIPFFSGAGFIIYQDYSGSWVDGGSGETRRVRRSLVLGCPRTAGDSFWLNIERQRTAPAWNSGTTYNGGDQVSYGGAIYASNINDNLGITPPGSEGEWEYIDDEGWEAIEGVDFIYRAATAGPLGYYRCCTITFQIAVDWTAGVGVRDVDQETTIENNKCCSVEGELPIWDNAVTYSAGAVVVYADVLWTSLQNGNTNHTPGNFADPGWWSSGADWDCQDTDADNCPDNATCDDLESP